jgi:hypothetical protein
MLKAAVCEYGPTMTLAALEDDATRLVSVPANLKVFFGGGENLDKLVQWAKIPLKNRQENPGSIGLDHNIE